MDPTPIVLLKPNRQNSKLKMGGLGPCGLPGSATYGSQ